MSKMAPPRRILYRFSYGALCLNWNLPFSLNWVESTTFMPLLSASISDIVLRLPGFFTVPEMVKALLSVQENMIRHDNTIVYNVKRVFIFILILILLLTVDLFSADLSCLLSFSLFRP